MAVANLIIFAVWPTLSYNVRMMHFGEGVMKLYMRKNVKKAVFFLPVNILVV